jgi:hypothetical protein
VDAVLQLIGVERVGRRYDRESALCCSGAITQWDKERGAAIRARNVDDAKSADAQAMCYLCPMCYRVLSPDAEAKGLANYHIIELARMSLGELPLSPVAGRPMPGRRPQNGPVFPSLIRVATQSPASCGSRSR